MRRREFLSLVGGTVVVWPLTARAQQTERMRRIGGLIAFAENDPEQRARNTAFLNRLEELGWKDGRNLRIDYRFSEGDPERMRAHARELVALSPDLILVQTNPALTALLQTTSTRDALANRPAKSLPAKAFAVCHTGSAVGKVAPVAHPAPPAGIPAPEVPSRSPAALSIKKEGGRGITEDCRPGARNF